MTVGRSAPPAFAAAGRVVPLTVRRHAAARRMRLAVDPRDGAVRLTLPPRASLAAGYRFVEAHRGFVEQALARVPGPRPFLPGGTLPIEGVEHRIDWSPAYPRRVERGDGTVRVGGPEALLPGRLLRWLQAEALARLETGTRGCAARAGVTVGRVGIGDPRGRWGSCTARGDIRYSWRLFLAPPAVLEATVAHEVAHRLHMDHSPAFHAAVTRLLGRPADAERAWLKAHGAALHRVGRAG